MAKHVNFSQPGNPIILVFSNQALRHISRRLPSLMSQSGGM